MGIYHHITQLNGLPVRDFLPHQPLVQPGECAYRIGAQPRIDHESSWVDSAGCLGSFAALMAGLIYGSNQSILGGIAITVIGILFCIGSADIVRRIIRRFRRGWYCPNCGERLPERWATECNVCEATWETDDMELSRAMLLEMGRAGSMITEFMTRPTATETAGLIIAAASVTEDASSEFSHIDSLVEVADQLPNLRALCIGELIQHECELSWIDHGDLTRLTKAFPDLNHLTIRGSFTLAPFASSHLQTLVIESCMLSINVLENILKSQLPNLKDLEIWTGSPEQGCDCTVFEFRPLFEQRLFPHLKRLAIRNCEFADEIVESLATTSWMKQIEELDLSMGTLSDRGAQALLKANWLPSLQLLNIRHHFVSPQYVEQLQAMGVIVDAEESQWSGAGDESDEERYCAIGE